MIVVDASAVLGLLLHAPASERIDARLFDYADTLLAPHLLDVEVTQILRRYAIAGLIGDARGELAIAALRGCWEESGNCGTVSPRTMPPMWPLSKYSMHRCLHATDARRGRRAPRES